MPPSSDLREPLPVLSPKLGGQRLVKSVGFALIRKKPALSVPGDFKKSAIPGTALAK
jgi:hypothetical protein